ncbi:MAG: aminoacyl-tRNA hydrolase [Bacteroidetes bacterium]|jgi:ribosome-associated protein|nr:aminoacyl-tRNA hydrolase [Bacteroidota bacterium]|tara:strand:- start:318 stop:716 length:399 start_codon:yes stop_codon:yes gene_type:complete
MFEKLISEVKYKFSRSSGPGGQSVNKVSTQVELLFDIDSSVFLSDKEKIIISEKLKNRITNDGILALKCDETRSQLKNKELVLQRFLKLVEEALKPEKERKPTKPSPASKEKRLRNKKIQSEKKKDRKITDD